MSLYSRNHVRRLIWFILTLIIISTLTIINTYNYTPLTHIYHHIVIINYTQNNDTSPYFQLETIDKNHASHDLPPCIDIIQKDMDIEQGIDCIIKHEQFELQKQLKGGAQGIIILATTANDKQQECVIKKAIETKQISKRFRNEQRWKTKIPELMVTKQLYDYFSSPQIFETFGLNYPPTVQFIIGEQREENNRMNKSEFVMAELYYNQGDIIHFMNSIKIGGKNDAFLQKYGDKIVYKFLKVWSIISSKMWNLGWINWDLYAVNTFIEFRKQMSFDHTFDIDELMIIPGDYGNIATKTNVSDGIQREQTEHILWLLDISRYVYKSRIVSVKIMEVRDLQSKKQYITWSEFNEWLSESKSQFNQPILKGDAAKRLLSFGAQKSSYNYSNSDGIISWSNSEDQIFYMH